MTVSTVFVTGSTAFLTGSTACVTGSTAVVTVVTVCSTTGTTAFTTGVTVVAIGSAGLGGTGVGAGGREGAGVGSTGGAGTTALGVVGESDGAAARVGEGSEVVAIGSVVEAAVAAATDGDEGAAERRVGTRVGTVVRAARFDGATAVLVRTCGAPWRVGRGATSVRRTPATAAVWAAGSPGARTIAPVAELEPDPSAEASSAQGTSAAAIRSTAAGIGNESPVTARSGTGRHRPTARTRRSSQALDRAIGVV